MSIKNSAVNLRYLSDTSSEATANKLIFRDENGTAKFGEPTDPAHPVRLGDLSQLDVGSGEGGGTSGGDMVRMDFLGDVEDALHPSAFPYEFGVGSAFFGVVDEKVAAEDFNQSGIYQTYFTVVSPDMMYVYQYLDGDRYRYLRLGVVMLSEGVPTVMAMEWSPTSMVLGTARQPMTFHPNIPYNWDEAVLLFTVSVANATDTVTVTQGTEVILKWTPTSIADTHTFTFSSVPGEGSIVIGSSGSFTTSNGWRVI